MNIEPFDICGTKVINGRLMNPAELQEALQQLVTPGIRADWWCLCGDVSRTMFDAIGKNGSGVGIRLSAFTGPEGGAYATITQQSGGMQHRFLLPLYEPAVIAFLKALERQPIQAMLGRQGEARAVMLHTDLPWRNIAPVVGMCQHSRPVEVEKTLAEMMEAIRAVCLPETIPSVYNGVPLTQVSVSVVMPMEYCLSAPNGAEELVVALR